MTAAAEGRRSPPCLPPTACFSWPAFRLPLLFTGDPVTDGELLHVPTMRHLLQPM